MIINLRGANGSGKSTIVKALLDSYPHKSCYGVLGPRLPEAYNIALPKRNRPLHLLGPYLTPTGGMDVVQPYDLIPGLISKYAVKGDVIFEGVLISKSKGAVGEHLEQWGKNAVLVFLDTPLDVCIASVQKRRDGRGDERKFNPRNLTEAFKGCNRVRKTLLGEGKLRILDASRDNAFGLILDLLYGRA